MNNLTFLSMLAQHKAEELAALMQKMQSEIDPDDYPAESKNMSKSITDMERCRVHLPTIE